MKSNQFIRVEAMRKIHQFAWRIVLIGLVFGSIGVSAPDARGEIVFHKLSFGSAVNDYLGEYPYDDGDGFTDADPQLPLQGTYTAEKGECRSVSEIDADWTADGVSFSITADHVRGGDYAGIKYKDYSGTRFILYFTIDKSYHYTIEGQYSLIGAGTLYTSARLNKSGQDIGDDAWIFGNQQSSENTEYEVLTIGEEGGDEENSLYGSTSGLLMPDTYCVMIGYSTGAPSGGDNGALSQGWANFTLTPEPASAVMFLITGIWILRRRGTPRI
jgi:hypothetical protein